MTTTAPEPATRMRSEDRRLLILEAATAVFGERGYHGATTDVIARAAGVSQPYVVRIFGSKEALFLEVVDRALERILGSFRAALDEAAGSDAQLGPHELAGCVARHYVDLLADRGLLLCLMQAFLLGSDPVVGPAARGGLRRVHVFLRDEVGLAPDDIREFLANGMLLNTVVGLRMADDYESDPVSRELLDQVLPTKLPLLLELRNRES
ncbi:TetR/AcrR family transcriptional regulator [Protaetiibacter larvae]|nr:TetR/AcrR family transcriptional regulator [Protaetiibacter larvae]